MRSLPDIFSINIEALIRVFMKFLCQILIVTILFSVSACRAYNQERTSAAQAAYGAAVSDFKVNNNKNQKRKKKARREAKRSDSRTTRSVWQGRPY